MAQQQPQLTVVLTVSNETIQWHWRIVLRKMLLMTQNKELKRANQFADKYYIGSSSALCTQTEGNGDQLVDEHFVSLLVDDEKSAKKKRYALQNKVTQMLGSESLYLWHLFVLNIGTNRIRRINFPILSIPSTPYKSWSPNNSLL